MEKCVSGNLETVTVTNGGNRTSENTSLDVDPLQWSVTAAAGAQVNFTSRLVCIWNRESRITLMTTVAWRQYERNIRSILICSWVCALM